MVFYLGSSSGVQKNVFPTKDSNVVENFILHKIISFI